jgi:hemolysin III
MSGIVEIHPTSGYTPAIERLNSLSHALGIIMGVVALVLMLVWSSLYGTTTLMIACTIYGTTLILLYTASTCYHTARSLSRKRFFMVCDHSCIYLLIAGTYTPITLGPLIGTLGWTIFFLVWGLAAAGLIKEIAFPSRGGFWSTLIYLGMGWLCLVAIVPLWNNLSLFSFACLFGGGLAYSFGCIFYLWKRLHYHHVLWHLFVLLGSFLHFLAIFSFLQPQQLQ